MRPIAENTRSVYPQVVDELKLAVEPTGSYSMVPYSLTWPEPLEAKTETG